MAVDQHQQARRGGSADAAQRHLPGGPARNAVSHDAASRDEQPRDLLGQRRKQRRSESLGDLLPSDDGDGHRQMPDVGFMPGSRDNDLSDRVGLSAAQAVGGFGPQGAYGEDAARQQQYKQFKLHLFRIMFYSDIFLVLHRILAFLQFLFQNPPGTGECRIPDALQASACAFRRVSCSESGKQLITLWKIPGNRSRYGFGSICAMPSDACILPFRSSPASVSCWPI